MRNDDLFFEQLEVGHRYATMVADSLRSAGLAVEVTPMERRDRVEDRGRFVDEFDLLVGTRDPCVVDVKSRALEFTGRGDYPFPTAIVDTVEGWKAKKTKPKAIVVVSQSTGAMAVVSVRRTEDQWVSERRFDRVRQIYDHFYMLRREALLDFEVLVDWLKEGEAS